jgi:hypothetical protein
MDLAVGMVPVVGLGLKVDGLEDIISHFPQYSSLFRHCSNISFSIHLVSVLVSVAASKPSIKSGCRLGINPRTLIRLCHHQ